MGFNNVRYKTLNCCSLDFIDKTTDLCSCCYALSPRFSNEPRAFHALWSLCALYLLACQVIVTVRWFRSFWLRPLLPVWRHIERCSPPSCVESPVPKPIQLVSRVFPLDLIPFGLLCDLVVSKMVTPAGTHRAKSRSTYYFCAHWI